MGRPLLEDYLRKSQFTDVQADALSTIMADMTRTFGTKEDLFALESRIDARFEGMAAGMDARFEGMAARMDARFEGMEARMDARFEGMEARMNARFESIEARLESRLAATDAKLTWRMIAVVGFFATAATLLNIFLG